jgi:hypothetical protein
LRSTLRIETGVGSLLTGSGSGCCFVAPNDGFIADRPITWFRLAWHWIFNVLICSKLSSLRLLRSGGIA